MIKFLYSRYIWGVFRVLLPLKNSGREALSTSCAESHRNHAEWAGTRCSSTLPPSAAAGAEAGAGASSIGSAFTVGASAAAVAAAASFLARLAACSASTCSLLAFLSILSRSHRSAFILRSCSLTTLVLSSSSLSSSCVTTSTALAP